MVVNISEKGLKGLKDTQESMSKIINQMSIDVHELRESVNGLSNALGAHEEQYRKMISSIENEIQEAKTPVMNLHTKLDEVIVRMENFLKK